MPLTDEFDGSLFPNPRNAGNVISRISHEALYIHHPGWFHTELSLYLLDADVLALHGVEHGHMLRDQLHQIFIAGDDDYLSALFFPTCGQSCNNVVGLVAFQFYSRNMISADHIFNAGNLWA